VLGGERSWLGLSSGPSAALRDSMQGAAAMLFGSLNTECPIDQRVTAKRQFVPLELLSFI
jgi:hypothetical protein